jgi:NADPH-dependent curcumin reductase CurA
MTATNQQIVLASRPEGEATAANFRLEAKPVPALADNQVLVRHHFLSLDPYMRGRMNAGKSYAQPQPLDQVMIGGTAGEVVESRHANFKAGDKVVGIGGWQQYSVVDVSQPGTLRKVDTTHIPLSAYLGAVGMPGVTAWYGLVKICTPKEARSAVRWGSWPRCAAAARSASPAGPTSAATWSRNWASTRASTTRRTAIRRRCTLR